LFNVLVRYTPHTSGACVGFYFHGASDGAAYHCVAEPLSAPGGTVDGFAAEDSAVVLLWDCEADDTTNLDRGLYIGNTADVTTKYCTFHAKAAGSDVLQAAAGTAWDSYKDQVDPLNCTLVGTTDMLDADAGDSYAFKVKNTSGGAASPGAVGYIDAAGEYKTTATAYNDVEWCVVVFGGPNNGNIWVARRGRITVTLNGNCSIGDYLYTSTTAGQAQPSSTARWEMFGVALTANAAGAGRTCEALLLCHRKMTPYFNTNYVFQLAAAADDSDWSTTIAALPGGAVVTYTVPLGAGAENAIDVSGAGLLGKLVLHNTTRGTSTFINTVNIGANQITLTAAVPGGWIVGDTITVRSQTNVAAVGAARFFDVYVGGSFDATTVGLLMSDYFTDSGAAYILHGIHTYEAYSAAKFVSVRNSVAGMPIYRNMFMGIVDQRFTVMWNANGVNTALASLIMVAMVKAVP